MNGIRIQYICRDHRKLDAALRRALVEIIKKRGYDINKDAKYENWRGIRKRKK